MQTWRAVENFGSTDTIVLDTNHGDPNVNHTAFPSVTVLMIDWAMARCTSPALCAAATATDTLSCSCQGLDSSV